MIYSLSGQRTGAENQRLWLDPQLRCLNLVFPFLRLNVTAFFLSIGVFGMD